MHFAGWARDGSRCYKIQEMMPAVCYSSFLPFSSRHRRLRFIFARVYLLRMERCGGGGRRVFTTKSG